MFTRKFNDTVTIVSQILNYVVIIIFVVLLSTLVLWIINPSETDVYTDNSIEVSNTDISKFIMDQRPFGVRIIPVAPPVIIPRLYTELKVSGIYYNPPNDSVAFIIYQNKIYYFKEKDSIIKRNVTLSKINPDSISVTENGKVDTVSLSKM